MPDGDAPPKRRYATLARTLSLTYSRNSYSLGIPSITHTRKFLSVRRLNTNVTIARVVVRHALRHSSSSGGEGAGVGGGGGWVAASECFSSHFEMVVNVPLHARTEPDMRYRTSS